MAGEGEETAYQEGDIQLQRMNRLQSQINECNLNLEGFNNELEKYNYLIKFDCLDTLFSEVSSSCDPEEKKKSKRYRLAINKLLILKSPYKTKSVSDGWNSIKKQIVFFKKDFDTLKNILFENELFIKSLIHKYFRRGINEEEIPKEW